MPVARFAERGRKWVRASREGRGGFGPCRGWSPPPEEATAARGLAPPLPRPRPALSRRFRCRCARLDRPTPHRPAARRELRSLREHDRAKATAWHLSLAASIAWPVRGP